MYKTMTRAGGIGLAAPQVGISKRICVIKVKTPLYLINPTIVKKRGKVKSYEGCLSFPNKIVGVWRYKNIEVAFDNMQGERKKFKAKGLSARCIQHEMDHLEGILFVDKDAKYL